MDENKIKFLQDINNGTVKGAQKIIAQKLKISNTSVSLWFRGSTQPSLDSIIKMAKIFNKTEQEIREVFNVYDKNISVDSSAFVDIKDMKLLEEKMKRFETEIEYLKNRMDILEKKK